MATKLRHNAKGVSKSGCGYGIMTGNIGSLTLGPGLRVSHTLGSNHEYNTPISCTIESLIPYVREYMDI